MLFCQLEARARLGCRKGIVNAAGVPGARVTGWPGAGAVAIWQGWRQRRGARGETLRCIAAAAIWRVW